MDYVTSKFTLKNLTANQLKFIAIIAMFIDHIAVVLVSNQSILGQVMHTIGRITMPIMCYFIAEGYHKTRDIKKYVLRLLTFAIICHYSFFFFATGVAPISFGENIKIQIQFPTSVIFTLFLGLIALIVWNCENIKKYIKLIIIFGICIISMVGDWGYIAVLWILVFGVNYGNFKNQVMGFWIVSMILISNPIMRLLNIYDGIWWEQAYQFGLLLSIPLLSQYNGYLGKYKNAKWIFYIFYPLHLLILGYLKYYIL
ncbi:TraX family protein [Clostridium sp. CCUG 7971]|uniref:TraX family protein n=1 Tax=Clostridium sp. CCUG 7971 TaxID=2811414 RepID=UPI001ABB4516|nr:TraX family protein [Clostridium sp. CCUG 7971]MBO3444910.1 pilus assembly protein [Clostridium sp. CCUG 7971]